MIQVRRGCDKFLLLTMPDVYPQVLHNYNKQRKNSVRKVPLTTLLSTARANNTNDSLLLYGILVFSLKFLKQ